ncbi:hypothetical protein GCM10022217_28940 [Chryseobacterium ginsenosidimutans]|uniref:hypothetical protein n=1 Tax=Chryseobacterium ginsenosidimutans TaxID=687846 RepID=UPI0031DD226C
MDFHNQFTLYHFLAFTILLLVISFIILRFKKLNGKTLLDWKVGLLALLVTLLGLFYSETSNAKDWIVKSYGFPRGFYLEKISSGKDAFISWGIVRLDYMNFVQNFILFFLLINIFRLILKKRS